MADEELRRRERAARGGDPAAAAAWARALARAGRREAWTVAARVPLPDPRDVVVGPDGRVRVAVLGDAGGAVHVLDPATGARVARWADRGARRLALAPGALLTAGGPEPYEVPGRSTQIGDLDEVVEGGSACAWDDPPAAGAGPRWRAEWPGPAVSALAPAPGGALACGPEPLLVDAGGARPAWPPRRVHPAARCRVAADGARVVTAAGTELLRWRLDAGGLRQEQAQALPLAALRHGLALAGGRLATGRNRRGPATVELLDLDALDREPVTLAQADAAEVALAFSPDGGLLAVGGRAVTVLDLRSGDARAVLPTRARGRPRVGAVALGPGGERAAAGLDRGEVRVLSASGAPVVLAPGDGPPGGGPPAALAFAADGALLRAVRGRRVETWRVADGARVGAFDLPTEARAAAFAADGAVVAVLDPWDGRSFCPRSARELAAWSADGAPLPVHEERGQGLAPVGVTPAGDLVGLDGPRALARRPGDGLVTRVFADGVTAAALAEDGAVLFTAGAAGLRAWRVADGALLAASGADEADGGEGADEAEGEDAPAAPPEVVDLRPAPGGRLVGACADGRVRLWDAASLALVGRSAPGAAPARRVAAGHGLVVTCEADGVTLWRRAGG